MLLWYGCFVLVLAAVSAFNFAPESAQVFSDPSNDSESLFGYAVALRKQTSYGSSVPGVLVGAPQGNYEFQKLSKLKRPGNVYWCLLNGDPCKEIVIDKTVSHGGTGNRSLSYLGSSLDVLDSENGFTVCSPHWRNEETENSSVMNGMCYWNHNTGDVQKIFTLFEFDYQSLEDGVPTPFYAYGEAGFSVSVTQDGSEVLIGAPGVFQWKGAVLRYVVANNELHTPVPNTIYPESFQNDSYFGYSVGYGSFPQINKTVYVASAPRAADCKGKVFIFDFVNKSGVWNYEILKEWEGTQLGEYFGSSLGIADFNNDGFDDVLVGAPTYSFKSIGQMNAVGDEGCVYVFISDEETGWKVTENPTILMGSQKHGARFGSAISVLGDINMDSYPDVAIGAPFEDDSRGVVYIYLGTKDGLNPEYSQKLVAKEIDLNLKGFGFSISRGFDVDDNHFNDLAIGSHRSNNVVLIKTYPIVTIHPAVIPKVKRIGSNDTELNVSVCVTYSGKNVPDNIYVLVIVKADPVYKRAQFPSGEKVYSYNTTLVHSTNPDCRNFTLEIEEQKNFYKPIDISVEYELHSQKKRETATNKSKNFCKDCPILNTTDIYWKKVPYGIGCKEDTKCLVDLGIEAKFVNVKSPFVIGTEDFITFEVELESKNDPAYMSQVSIIFPRFLHFRKIPIDCQENGTTHFGRNMSQFLCDIDGPLKQGMKHNLSLQFNMMDIPLNITDLRINISAISSDEDPDESNNHVLLVLPLQTEFNVALTGVSVPEQMGFATKKKDSDELIIQDKNFTHTFLITNKGPTPAKFLVMDFKVPYGVTLGTNIIELLDVPKLVDGQDRHLNCKIHNDTDLTEDSVVRSPINRHAAESDDWSTNRTLTLDCSLSHVRCSNIQCKPEKGFLKNSAVTISFFMQTKLKQSESLLEKKDLIVVSSSATATFSENKILEKVIQITLWRTLPVEGAAWWIYLIAIIGGFLILAALIWGLYKLGFFRRDKQMQLQAMKHSSMVEQEFLCENENVDT